jgi:hypothetical protein
MSPPSASAQRRSAEHLQEFGHFPWIPEVVPAKDWAFRSWLTMTVAEGVVLTWREGTPARAELKGEVRLQVETNQPVVIGRQNGGETEYLDPLYRPTPNMPTSGQPIVTSAWGEKDRLVSRAHFMIKASPLGLILVNGVPRRGGGIRPPTNWTCLLAPIRRQMEKGEEFLIERGSSATISLPNGTTIRIDSE